MIIFEEHRKHDDQDGDDNVVRRAGWRWRSERRSEWWLANHFALASTDRRKAETPVGPKKWFLREVAENVITDASDSTAITGVIKTLATDSHDGKKKHPEYESNDGEYSHRDVSDDGRDNFSREDEKNLLPAQRRGIYYVWYTGRYYPDQFGGKESQMYKQARFNPRSQFFPPLSPHENFLNAYGMKSHRRKQRQKGTWYRTIPRLCSWFTWLWGGRKKKRDEKEAEGERKEKEEGDREGDGRKKIRR